jgi:hypothetical protein
VPNADFGILVSDLGHPDDIVEKVEQSVLRFHGDTARGILQSVVDFLGALKQSIRSWITNEFFKDHISRYSKSRRRAPIYWQLSTPSASYSVWLYYHTLTKDAFFKVLNDYVKPKLDHERKKLDRLRGEAGNEPALSQRKEIEEQERFVSELASMTEEIARIAPLWNPNLNDGVIINFAPLWRLVPQNKSWQEECKSCWDKLVTGDYDWAHLAMHLWPERVVPKCATDASLAIAHGLEGVFWRQDDRDRFQPLDAPEFGWGPVIQKLVMERTSPAVKAALQSLLDAPASGGNKRTTRRRSSST